MLRLLRATYVGTVAARALSGPGPESVGEIVATFPSSIYMKTPNRESVFITNRQLKSPITINLDSTLNWAQGIEVHDTVSLRSNAIHIGHTTSIDLSAASSYRNANDQANLPIQRFGIPLDGLLVASLILRTIDSRRSVLDPAGVAHDGVRDFIADGIIPLRLKYDHKRFRAAARRIVGLGDGFTPSGDDLLGGFLATYNSLAPQIDREKIFMDLDFLLRNTGWVSAKLLDHMQRQVLDEQVERLIVAVTSGDSDEFTDALETLLPRGHTSGIDIAVGVTLGASLVQDIGLRGDVTGSVVRRLGLDS